MSVSDVGRNNSFLSTSIYSIKQKLCRRKQKHAVFGEDYEVLPKLAQIATKPAGSAAVAAGERGIKRNPQPGNFGGLGPKLD